MAIREVCNRRIVLHHGEKFLQRKCSAAESRPASSRATRSSYPVLEVPGLRAGYRGVEILRNVSLSVGADDRVTLVGSNGANAERVGDDPWYYWHDSSDDSYDCSTERPLLLNRIPVAFEEETDHTAS